jgi:hypothetical protein
VLVAAAVPHEAAPTTRATAKAAARNSFWADFGVVFITASF